MDGQDIMDAVAFARMEGKIDVLNERHATILAEQSDQKQRMHTHSNRIQILETEARVLKGEKAATVAVIRMLWAILAVMLGGGATTVFLFLKVLNHA